MCSKELKDTTTKKFNIRKTCILKESHLHIFECTDTSYLVQELPNKHYLQFTLFFGWNLICTAETRNLWLEMDA